MLRMFQISRKEKSDPRFVALYDQLSRLAPEQLLRIRANRDQLVLDDCNYDEQSGKFCPLAIALYINRAKDDQDCADQIRALGFEPRNLKGVVGEFFTTDRLADLDRLLQLLLTKKGYGCIALWHHTRTGCFGGSNFCSNCGKSWKSY